MGIAVQPKAVVLVPVLSSTIRRTRDSDNLTGASLPCISLHHLAGSGDRLPRFDVADLDTMMDAGKAKSIESTQP